MKPVAKPLVWGLLVICSFSCILGQQFYGGGQNNGDQNNNANAYASTYAAPSTSAATATASASSSSTSFSSSSSTSTSNNFMQPQQFSQPITPNPAWAFPGFDWNLMRSGPQENTQNLPPPPQPIPPPPSPAYSATCGVQYQVKPQDCCAGHRVICVDQMQQSGRHPCDVALNDNSNIYSNILCMQYTCKDKLKIGDQIRDDLTCKAVFYDPGTHYAVDPLQHFKEKDPCQQCQKNSMTAPNKKVCCGGQEFDNMCLATCQDLDVHCQQGPCQQNKEAPTTCVGDCYQSGIFQSEPFCCEGQTYTNKCTASCFYDDAQFNSKCYKKETDSCQPIDNNIKKENAEVTASASASSGDTPKAINFDELIINLQEMSISGNTAFTIGGGR